MVWWYMTSLNSGGRLRNVAVVFWFAIFAHWLLVFVPTRYINGHLWKLRKHELVKDVFVTAELGGKLENEQCTKMH